MPQKKRFRVSKIGIVLKPKSYVCGSTGKRQRGKERINERDTDSVIEALFYSSSCNIISTVLTSCQGLRLVDNCVHFSHGAHSKGLLFSISTTLLSREYRRSHARRTGADTNTHTFAPIALCFHTH